MDATWYKLKDGKWGVKIRHDGQPGEEVTVTNKKGDSKQVFLNARVAKFDDAQLWSISDAPLPKQAGEAAPVGQHSIEEPF
jgi:hypothetical protein